MTCRSLVLLTDGVSRSNAKTLMRIQFIHALSSRMAMGAASVTMAIALAFLLTLMRLLIGFLLVTARYGPELQQRFKRIRMDLRRFDMSWKLSRRLVAGGRRKG